MKKKRHDEVSKWNPDKKQFRYLAAGTLLCLIWILVISALLWVEIDGQNKSISELAVIEARASYHKDVAYRRWSSGHGGTYVPATDQTPANPYLSHIHERDITTPSGRALTLVNPAYMTRQVHIISENQYGIKGHITSLNPLRPENAPDSWEKEALQAFEKGEKEIQSVRLIEGAAYLRLMRPLVAEKGCLKCHADQGYKEGDYRGGVSVSVPLAPYQRIAGQNIKRLVGIHVVIMLIGCFCLIVTFFVLHKNGRREKEVANALQKSEERFGLAVQGTQDGVWDWDILTNKEYFAPRWCEILGYPADDPALVHTFDSWSSRIHPDDNQMVMDALKAHLKENIPYNVIYRHRHRSGEYRWQNSRGQAVFDSSGKPIRMVGSIRDITEEKSAEEALRSSEEKFSKVFQNAPLLMTLSSIKDGRYIEVNDAFVKVTGYSREDSVSSTSTDLGFIHPSDRQILANELKTKGRVHNMELSLTRADGTELICMYFGEIVEVEGKQRLLSIASDITDRKVMESRLLQAQKMESIGNLAGGIAHDFNNLLFPIIGMSELLLEDLPTGSLEHENVKEIFTAGKRAGDLVKQILAFSRQSEHKMIPVRIQQILKEVIKLIRSTLPATIRLEHDIQEGCGLVNADSTQIHQVAMNLITNAFHAVSQEQGTIKIRLSQETITSPDRVDHLLKPGDYVKLEVADNGSGIDPTIKDKIFEPYFTTKEKGKGTGLGLAAVYGIINEHKGHIRVDSETGEGSTFTVYLPLKETLPGPEPDEHQEKLETGDEAILLVDDEASIARLQKQMLERLGYQVTSRTSSQDALSLFMADPGRFDLVLSDMTMPGLSGEQLAESLLSINPEIPIIICTGFSERINEEQARQIGIKGFLMKPIVKSELAGMVRVVLDESKGRRSDSV